MTDACHREPMNRLDLPVDLPLDLTPEVAQTENFDPADVLSSGRPAARPGAPLAPAPQAVTPDRRPSIAELMKDFESSHIRHVKVKKEYVWTMFQNQLHRQARALDHGFANQNVRINHNSRGWIGHV